MNKIYLDVLKFGEFFFVVESLKIVKIGQNISDKKTELYGNFERNKKKKSRLSKITEMT